MRQNQIAYSLIVLLLFFFGCGEDDTRGEILFTQITLDSVSLQFITEENRQEESWDDNGGAPDIYLQASVEGGVILTITDTLVDFQPGDVFMMRETIVLEREDRLVNFTFQDFDFVPGLPPEFQSNDQVGGVTLDPWGEDRLNFVDMDELNVSNQLLDITFYLTRE